MPLTDPIERARLRRASDAKRFRELDENECQLCHAQGQDKRGLRISCLYAMEEVIDEMIDLHDVAGQAPGYYLRICKRCRADLLGMLQRWREICIARRDREKDHDGNPEICTEEDTVPVRVNGNLRMMTPEEYRIYHEREGD